MSQLSGTWNLDPTFSSVDFVLRYAMVNKFRGKFTDYSATIEFDQEHPENSRAQAAIKMASLNTLHSERDAHVRNADFFDTENYPEATFASTAFNVDEHGTGTVDGELTLKGTTHPVTFEVETFGIEEDAYGALRLGFQATTTIDRAAFGIDFNMPIKTGGVMISNEIDIEINGSAVRA